MKCFPALLISFLLFLTLGSATPAPALARRDAWLDVSTAKPKVPSPPKNAKVTSCTTGGGSTSILRWLSCTKSQTTSYSGITAEIDWACRKLSSAGVMAPYTTWIVSRNFKGRKLEWFIHNYVVPGTWLDVSYEFCRKELRMVVDACSKGTGSAKTATMGWTKNPKDFMVIHAVRFADA